MPRTAVAALAVAVGLALGTSGIALAQSGPVPAEQTAAAFADPNWEVPRFSWGDPSLEGTFTSRDMSGVQMERSQQYGTRQSMTLEVFQARSGRGGGGGLLGQRGGEEFEGQPRLQLSALDSGETGTRTFGYTSYLIEPEDGRMPAMTAAGRARSGGGRGGQANGPFYTMDDFSYYDRCITRGLVGSVMPSLYGDRRRRGPSRLTRLC
jgi:hypothetical protein